MLVVGDLRITQRTFQAAAEALGKAAGSMAATKNVSAGNLGGAELQSVATESAPLWASICVGLKDALDGQTRESVVAAQTFDRVDAALADAAQGGTWATGPTPGPAPGPVSGS